MGTPKDSPSARRAATKKPAPKTPAPPKPAPKTPAPKKASAPKPPASPRGWVDGIKPVWRGNDAALREIRQPYLVDGRPPPPGRLLGKAYDMEAPEDGWPPGFLDDRELVGCALTGWPIAARNDAPPDTPEWLRRRPVIRNLHLRETAVYTTGFEGFVFDDCVFEGLRLSKPFFLRRCGFRHVKLRGFVGAMDISERGGEPGGPIDAHPERVRHGAVDDTFYDDVDWALDLREADLSELSIAGIPPEKILRNPELHAILRREDADVERFLAVPGVEYTWFPNQAMEVARGHAPSCLLLAHPRSSSFVRDREAIAALRRAGLVE